VWVFITVLSSEQPFVSFKYFLSRFWFVVVFYFLGVALFRKFGNIQNYLWLYIIALCGVVVFTLVKHSAYNFDQHYSFTIQQPFYVGHGVYAAAIAFFIPLLFIYLLYPSKFRLNAVAWPVVLAVLSLLLVGLFYSYTRAAWISIAAAVMALVPLLARIRLQSLLIIIVVTAVIGILFSSQIVYLMSRNQDESSKDFSEHINSISNIKTDASNAERINRWVCAIEMFKERPVFGWGPGTYKFEYAPFQMAKYRTVISTDFGDGGNSHSEYLNPLCEMGLVGMLSILYLFYHVLNTGFNLFYTARKPRVRLMSLAITLGMITYFVHGLMNNYSETDKIAVLFWGGFAMLTAMDMYHNKSLNNS
jgi:O-antigen ligase